VTQLPALDLDDGERAELSQFLNYSALFGVAYIFQKSLPLLSPISKAYRPYSSHRRIEGVYKAFLTVTSSYGHIY
jgi:hypothetical protein